MEVSRTEKETGGEDIFILHCWKEVCRAEREVEMKEVIFRVRQTTETLR